MKATIVNSDREEPMVLELGASATRLENDNEKIGDNAECVGTTNFVAIKQEQEAGISAKPKEQILGKFESVEELERAYLELQAEFTRKSQKLASLRRFQNVNNQTAVNFSSNNSAELNSELKENLQENIDSIENSSKSVDQGSRGNDFINMQSNLKNSSELTKNQSKLESLDGEIEDEEGADVSPKSSEDKGFESKDELCENDSSETVSDSDFGITKESLKEIETFSLSVGDESLKEKLTQKYQENGGFSDEKFGLTQAVFSVLNDKMQAMQKAFESEENLLNLVETHSEIKDKIIANYINDCAKNKVPPLINKTLGANMVASTPSKLTTLSEVASVLNDWLK